MNLMLREWRWLKSQINKNFLLRDSLAFLFYTLLVAIVYQRLINSDDIPNFIVGVAMVEGYTFARAKLNLTNSTD